MRNTWCKDGKKQQKGTNQGKWAKKKDKVWNTVLGDKKNKAVAYTYVRKYPPGRYRPMAFRGKIWKWVEKKEKNVKEKGGKPKNKDTLKLKE